MRGVILQPNYVPWYGYFELINTADVFVFLDDVQYTRRDWRNRNKVKTETEARWLTVPVVKCNRDMLLIKDVEIDNTKKWGISHYAILKQCYSKSPYWKVYEGLMESMYMRNWKNLSDFNIEFIVNISDILGLKTQFVRSSSLMVKGSKEKKLIGICKETGISTYISGPSGRNYIEKDNFINAGIGLDYYEYQTKPYNQIHGEFNPYVTILDLLFNCGHESINYIKKDV